MDSDDSERAAEKGPTPLLLITGFLGSGKTTFINRLLALPGPRLGVVVNEFGQVGIDGALLRDMSPNGSGILELANGCVCCVRGTEMWDAALTLVDRAGAEILLVETSGLVEPRALLEQYRLLPPPLASRIDLRGLLCLVDAAGAREAVARRPEATQQVELGDRLLISKLDLATPAQLLDTHRLLDELGASTERASVALGAPDAEIAGLFRWAMSPTPEKGRRSAAGKPGRPAHAHGGRQLMAVSLHEPEPLLHGPLAQLLGELRGEVLRVKGLVRVLGAPWAPAADAATPALAALHLAGRQVELTPFGGGGTGPDAVPAGSTLVFIGEDLDESWLRLRVTACRSRPAQSPSAAPSALSA